MSLTLARFKPTRMQCKYLECGRARVQLVQKHYTVGSVLHKSHWWNETLPSVILALTIRTVSAHIDPFDFDFDIQNICRKEQVVIKVCNVI